MPNAISNDTDLLTEIQCFWATEPAFLMSELSELEISELFLFLFFLSQFYCAEGLMVHMPYVQGSNEEAQLIRYESVSTR